MLEFFSQPWPWYVSGPLIGLLIPALLLIGNKLFGVSSSMKDICAATIPGNVKLFQYDWKAQSWRLLFVGGILVGGAFSMLILSNSDPIAISSATQVDLSELGITNFSGIAPQEIFNFESLLTLKGILIICFGGFLVGFGTRYANGCTSGHAIMGIANLQWPSLVATMCFFAGGLIMTHLILPFILKM